MDLPVFIINLDQHLVKYKNAKTALEKQGFINIQRIPAIDGIRHDIDNYSKTLTLHTQFLIDNPDYRCSHQQLNTLGGVGCYLSHVKCWKKMLEAGYPEIIVFEDDLNLIPNFKEEYNKMMESIPIDCDILSFGYLRLLDKHLFKGPIEMLRTKYYGTQAYYITKQGAEKLLSKAFPIEMQIDGYISLMNYYNYINIYFTKLILVTQQNITGSSINYIACYKCYLPNIIQNGTIFTIIFVIMLMLLPTIIKWFQ